MSVHILMINYGKNFNAIVYKMIFPVIKNKKEIK